MNADPKQQQHWKQQVVERRAKLDNIRSELRVAKQRYMMSGADIDAKNVTAFAERERLADEALTFAEDQLQRASEPPPVIIHSPAGELRSRKAQLEQRIAYRNQQFQAQVDHVRKRCGRMPEHHVKIVLQNELNAAEFGLKRENAADQLIIDDCDAQLAEIARQRAESQPHSAA